MPDTRIEWPSSATAQIVAYTQRLQEEALVAASKAVSYLHERVVARARLTPGWDELADHIEVWSQDGQLVIGVNDELYRSQAFALEYGDEVRPPSPLFRTLTAEVRDAGDVAREHMISKFGPGRFGGDTSAES